jgi:serine/threonine protein kinase/tetratricopeptide (TPR) repeat protein
MTEREWDRLQRLFERALELPEGEREDYLAEIALEDPDLATRIHAMVAKSTSGVPSLDRDLAQTAGAVLGSSSLPEQIGPYQLVRLLGEGGMGVVYLAERTDVGGHAALKLLRDAWLSPARRERFAAEQRVLAQLSHPGIAQLHGIGSLPDGTPWFAMEYVEGEPITRYCRERQRTVPERLRLLRAVAEAVQHAHAHAVIHRDLKPSNVLVTATGAVKLLDFGIAKQLDDSGEAGDRTVTGMRMLTPAYAAPEQFSGGPIGVRTDVFALGALLYELLTDKQPFSDSTGNDADRLAARFADVTRPSELVRAGTGAPGRANWRELDVIVQKAMHPDPARRYGTVDAMIRDLDHYLRGEPLEARPDSLGYRSGRFVRRNWQAVTATVTLVVAVIGLTVFYGVRLASARDSAVEEAERTGRIQQFMASLFQGGDEAAGAPDSLRVRTLLDRGVQEAVALEGEPAVQAELFVTLAGLLQQLGRGDDADSLYQRALTTRRELYGEGHPDVAVVLTGLGLLRIDQARLEDAEPLLRDAVRIVDRELTPNDTRAIEAHAALGQLFQEQSAWPEAVVEQERVLQRLAARGDAEFQEAEAMVQLASTHFYAGELDASDSLNRMAMAIFRRLRGDNHPRVADALINLGAAEFERGNYAAAEGQYREAVSRVEGWHGPEHPSTASALTMLGRALNFQTRDAEATEVLQRALTIQERHFGPNHPRVSSVLNDIATIAMRNGRYAEAEQMWLRTEAIQLAVHGESHWLLGIARSNLGTVRTRMEDFPRAERYFRQAIVLFTESQGADHLNTGIARIKLGRTLLGQRRWREAAEESRAGYDVLMALDQAPQGFIDAAKTDMVAAYEQLGDTEQAARFRP